MCNRLLRFLNVSRDWFAESRNNGDIFFVGVLLLVALWLLAGAYLSHLGWSFKDLCAEATYIANNSAER